MYLVYQLLFNDGTRYIGQTRDLNQRLAAHRTVWKNLFGLSIEGVKVLAHNLTPTKAKAVESAVINEIGLENLRNSNLSVSVDELDPSTLSEILPPDTEPDTPLEVLHHVDSIDEIEAQVRYLALKKKQLENRYITLYRQVERAKDNLRNVDAIVESVVDEVLRG